MRHDPASAAIVIMLRSLKVHGMAQAVTDLIEQGAPAFEAAVPILSQLLKAELAEREVRSIAYHMKAARFPAYKDLSGFDFTSSEINEATVRQLHRGDFIGKCRKPFSNSVRSTPPASSGGYMMYKGRHFDRSVILLCVRWYLAYGLSLRNLEEMMAERGISVDHATIHRWTVHYAPLLLDQFNRRKRVVTGKWHIDETYIKVRGQWRYLYRAIDSNGDTVEFWFSERRNLAAAKRFLRKALKRHGRPKRIVIDGSQTNREAILSCDTTDRLQDRSQRKLKPIRIRQSRYLNNRIEQDHRAIKRRVRSMLGFKSMDSARAILDGIEMVHMMRKEQAKYARAAQLSLAEQFEQLVA